jgi:hypothetical protein
MVEFSKQPPSWKIILEMTTGNIVICEVYALMHVVLSEKEKHVPYGETVNSTECVTLQTICRKILSRYIRVQLYI